MFNFKDQKYFNDIFFTVTAEQLNMSLSVVAAMYADPRTNRLKTGPVPLEARIPGRHYCNDCKKSYSEKKALARHQRERCGQTEKRFKCDLCGKEYLHLEGLEEHLSQKHDGEKAHKCNMCEAGFDRRHELKFHKMEMHGGAKQ